MPLVSPTFEDMLALLIAFLVLGAFDRSNQSRSYAFTHSVNFFRSDRTNCLLASTKSDNDNKMVWKVLVLHGKYDNGSNFRRTLQPLKKLLEEKNSNRNWEWTFLTAPYQIRKKDSSNEKFEWWTLKPGERSFTATEYGGFDASAKMVIQELPKYDFCIGHSQGAILLTSLLAQSSSLPILRGGYIWNGAAWPNPFNDQLESLSAYTEQQKNQNGLVIVGDNDDINPPEGALRVRDLLTNIGMEISTLHHKGGHSVPISDDVALQSIISWMLKMTEK